MERREFIGLSSLAAVGEVAAKRFESNTFTFGIPRSFEEHVQAESEVYSRRNQRGVSKA